MIDYYGIDILFKSFPIRFIPSENIFFPFPWIQGELSIFYIWIALKA